MSTTETSQRPVSVALVTSAAEHCGIREYGELLQQSLPHVNWHTYPPDSLSGTRFKRLVWEDGNVDVVHINHQAALHAAWTPHVVREIRQRLGVPVVVTVHDTFETRRTMEARGYPHFATIADHVIVHEWVEGLMDYDNVSMLHQPVPVRSTPAPACPFGRIGSFGFNFPWKGFDMLERAAAKVKWETNIYRTGDDGDTDWIPRDELPALLAANYVNAFLYQTGNSGTSGAVRTGISAGRPLILLRGCRQFRDLEYDRTGLGPAAICWANNEDEVADIMIALEEREFYNFQRAGIHALAHRDSWENAGKVYDTVYQRVVKGW